MPYETMPIVGAFYRPPAKLLLDVLAVGTPLTLIAEPTNPVDPNAVAVWLNSSDIPSRAHNDLRENLPQFGHTLESVLDQASWHVGFVPKEMAAQLKAEGVIVDGTDYPVTFAVNAKGAPRVRFPAPVL